MKRTLFLSILIVLFTMSFVGCNKKEEYGLQDKCGKGSQEWFKTNYSHRETNGWSYKYTNHYNKKLRWSGPFGQRTGIYKCKAALG